MSRIGSMMSVGKQSLANSQTALQTTSHNVANVNTEGYTRQRIEQQASEPIGNGRVRIGTGAKVGSVTRVADQFLTKQIQNENSKLGTANGKQDTLMRVEQVYNESINKGLNRFLANFFNSFREFANNPESQATRALVKENSKQLTEDFHRIHNQLVNIQGDVDSQITAKVSQINGYAKEIASLNDKIQLVEIQGIPANDERDRRDLLLKKMGELIDIRYGEGKDGRVAVTAGNTAVMVSGSEYNQLFTRSTPADDMKRESNVDIYFQNGEHGSQFKVTREFKGGEIGGALEARDVIVNDMHHKLDHIAYNLSEAVNEVHQNGYDRYNNTQKAFFSPLQGEAGAAENIGVHQDILNDPSLIAGGLSPNAPGDNRIANAIANLQAQPLLKEGTTTLDDYFNGMVGEFAVVTQRNDMQREHQKNIVSQLQNIRESTSGVSLDEETTDMVKYQKAFDASARIIKVADEMFDTVLNLKRL
jgi:flagellar hook-associated protein 1 FlgK